MLAKWPIRNKLLTGLGLLLVLVASLSYSGLHGLYAYRSWVKGLSQRLGELPLATTLSVQIGDLRVLLYEMRTLDTPNPLSEERFAREEVGVALQAVKRTLYSYRTELSIREIDDYGGIGNAEHEENTLAKIEQCVANVERMCDEQWWHAENGTFGPLAVEMSTLQNLAASLPRHLHETVSDRMAEVRREYRSLLVMSWITCVSAVVVFGLLLQLCYGWVFRPLRMLVKGSRKIASGQFDYRVKLDTQDEMAELAEALNQMTSRFCEIRDGLDRQVQERTKQVIRNEQLASVGFLAAGVAHEINNPLASIAMCAESLEGRMRDKSLGDEREDKVVRHYLQMIQTEAFRCKEITEKLLDFSRLGNQKRQRQNLRELVQNVIDMLAHLGKYQGKHVVLDSGPPLVATINAQEMKQVVLNLLTNGLDSVDAGGVVRVKLSEERGQAIVTVTDNGCGMTAEVLEHLFEPFFTRRRGGQGTGLGLSITYRIVADHNGLLEARSEGPGTGSQFRLILPLMEERQEDSHHHQAA